jgi:hypothetical protein
VAHSGECTSSPDFGGFPQAAWTVLLRLKSTLCKVSPYLSSPDRSRSTIAGFPQVRSTHLLRERRSPPLSGEQLAALAIGRNLCSEQGLVRRSTLGRVAHDLAPTERFDYHTPRFVVYLLGAFVLSVGLEELGDSSSRLSGAWFAVWGAYLVLGALRPPSVVVDHLGVTVRSKLRTRRYSFRELQGVDVAVAYGFPHFGREHLVLHQSNGRNRAFKQVMSRPPKDDPNSSLVRRAAIAIDARLSPAGGRLR